MPDNRYDRIIEYIFAKYFRAGNVEILFTREDIEEAARQLKIDLPKNLGDVIYTYRYRRAFPAGIRGKAPSGMEWTILPKGRGQYSFTAVPQSTIEPNKMLSETKVPDATPGAIAMYGNVLECL